MKTILPMSAHLFYELGAGHMLPTVDIAEQSEIVLEKRLPLTCMFEVYIAHSNNNRVGFFFKTIHEVENKGGYLLTYIRNKRPATEVDTLVKSEDLVIYNYPNKGTLAICPKVSSDIETIFLEQ